VEGLMKGLMERLAQSFMVKVLCLQAAEAL